MLFSGSLFAACALSLLELTCPFRNIFHTWSGIIDETSKQLSAQCHKLAQGTITLQALLLCGSLQSFMNVNASYSFNKSYQTTIYLLKGRYLSLKGKVDVW